MKKKNPPVPKVLTVFTLAMINVAAISSVKNWPFIAEYGFASLFYFIVAALVFFFPISLVSAELATGWPERGGVYLWVKEAFGEKWGFLAVWLQWIENVAYYPTILSFTAATIAYIFNPALSTNTAYTVVMVLLLFWSATMANLFGMKMSGWISKIGAICGTLIPATIIIVLGGLWIFEGNQLQIQFNFESLIPDFSLMTMVFFTGVVLSFAGMEMSAVHALDVEKPQRNYPRAILLSAILILIPSILGVLSIAIVIPQSDLNLTAGTMQAFTVFLSKYRLDWFIPIIATLTAIGLFGTVSTWIIGPTKGLHAAGQEGHLPTLFHKLNERRAPVSILVMQGILVTILSLMFLLMPTVSSGFWILTVLVAQLYLIMYVLVFAAAIKLRYSKPKVKREYKVPGGKPGIWIVGVLGILGSLFALVIGYFPPAQIEVGNATFYTSFLLGGSLIGCIAPFIILLFKKPSWKKD
jgi:glutamate:GABA antiporter